MERLAKVLQRHSISTFTLCGSLSATDRLQAVRQLVEGEGQSVLLATDVGSRGIDYECSVDLVVQFEMAKNVVAYVNRVGRTARMGQPGEAVTFVREDDAELAELMRERAEAGESLQPLFSRKRSLSKRGFYGQGAADEE